MADTDSPLYLPDDPNPYYWGVDSAGTVDQALFDFVTGHTGGPPTFWGRYISLAHAYKLQPKEINFLHDHGIKILVIYNGADPGSIKGGKTAGAQDAHDAIKAAQKLDVPAGVCIYVDIEAGKQWAVNSDWFLGWWETMEASDYENGAYANPLAWNAPNFATPYTTAWTSRWGSGTPPARQTYLYTPHNQAHGTCDTHPRGEGLRWDAAEPPCNAGQTILWQYKVDCYKRQPTDKYGQVDQDLATERAYSMMW